MALTLFAMMATFCIIALAIGFLELMDRVEKLEKRETGGRG